MRIFLLVLLASLVLAGCRTAEPPPEVTTVSVTIEDGHEVFVQFVAYQDGDGAWAELEPADGAYRFEVTDAAGRYGVALVCYHPDDVFEPNLEPIVLHATIDELSTLTLPCIEALYDDPDQVDGTLLTGRVVNVDPVVHGSLNVSAGRWGHDTTALQNYEFSVGFMYDGVFDVIAAVRDEGYAVSRLAIEHDVEVTGGGTAMVDWGTSHEVETFDLTIHGITPGDTIELDAHLRTKNDTWAGFTYDVATVNTSTLATNYSAAPQAVLAPGDLHSLWIGAEDADRQMRMVARHFTAGKDLEVTLPEGNLNLQATALPGGAYPRLAIKWDDVGATLISAHISYDTDELDAGWELFLTPGWLTENAYTLPDFSGLESWDPTWNVSEDDVYDTYNWFSAYFEPTEQALDSTIYWNEPREGEYRSIAARF